MLGYKHKHSLALFDPICTRLMPQPAQHASEYASPIVRSPSPASSVGTTYGPDQTSFSDSESEISQLAFEQKCQERIGLGLPTPEEVQASESPLLAVSSNPGEEMGEFRFM
jgi:hypothetical protein